jgi:hypothetical protein
MEEWKMGTRSRLSAPIVERLRADANAVGTYGGGYYQAEIREAADTIEALLGALEPMQEHWHHMIGLSSQQSWHILNAKAEAAIAKARS